MVFHQTLLALGLILVLIIFFQPKSLRSGRLPQSVEWATGGRGLFSMLKTIVYSMYSIRYTLQKGYDNVQCSHHSVQVMLFALTSVC